jgi:hypothetical protein
MSLLGAVSIEPFKDPEQSLSLKGRAEAVALHVLVVITALLTAVIISERCPEIRGAIASAAVLLVEALACLAIGGRLRSTSPWFGAMIFFATSSVCLIFMILARWK